MTTHLPAHRMLLLTILLAVPLLTLLPAQSVSGTGGSRGEEAALQAAAEEAQGWSDYNPSDLGTVALRTEAAEEAAGWPNFDSTNLADQVRKVDQAAEEAAGWPDFDPSSITIAVSYPPAPSSPHDAAY